MAEPARWKTIRDSLVGFRALLAPTVPEFELRHVNDRRWSQEQYLTMRKTGVYGLSGVYFHFGSDEELLYVGLAQYGFDRFWDSRPDDAALTDVLIVPPELDVLIPAIELWLIRTLNPPVNRAHRPRT
jgi:hypothetical protein